MREDTGDVAAAEGGIHGLNELGLGGIFAHGEGKV
jgi:hypothetical protein